MIKRKSGLASALILRRVSVSMCSLSGRGSLKNMKPYINVGISMMAIWACQPMPKSVINLEISAPITIPPGNQTWKRLSMAVRLRVYISAIIGLQAASTDPFAKPIKKVEINSVQNPPAYMVITRPMICEKNAIIINFFGPSKL